MYSNNIVKSKKQSNETPMFEKRTVVELNENEMTGVEGGSSSGCIIVAITLRVLTIV